MARKILNNGDSGLDFRTKSNDNFEELYRIANTFVSAYRNLDGTFSLTTTPITIPFADTVIYASDMTYNPLTGKFNTIYAGVYGFQFYFTGHWNNGTEIEIFSYVNGVANPAKGIKLTGGGSNKEIPIGIPATVILPANSEVELQVATTSGTANFVVVAGQITLALKSLT